MQLLATTALRAHLCPAVMITMQFLQQFIELRSVIGALRQSNAPATILRRKNERSGGCLHISTVPNSIHALIFLLLLQCVGSTVTFTSPSNSAQNWLADVGCLTVNMTVVGGGGGNSGNSGSCLTNGGNSAAGNGVAVFALFNLSNTGGGQQIISAYVGGGGPSGKNNYGSIYGMNGGSGGCASAVTYNNVLMVVAGAGGGGSVKGLSTGSCNTAGAGGAPAGTGKICSGGAGGTTTAAGVNIGLTVNTG